MELKLKLNNRVFTVNVKQSDNDTMMNEAYEQITEQINSNNESINNIFFEELLPVCNICGEELNHGNEVIKGICFHCEYCAHMYNQMNADKK